MLAKAFGEVTTHTSRVHSEDRGVFYTNKTLNVRGTLLDLGTPKVMGILNVTPDSFYDGGKFAMQNDALAQARKMIEEGATIVRIGTALFGARDTSL